MGREIGPGLGLGLRDRGCRAKAGILASALEAGEHIGGWERRVKGDRVGVQRER